MKRKEAMLTCFKLLTIPDPTRFLQTAVDIVKSIKVSRLRLVGYIMWKNKNGPRRKA